MEWHGRGAGPVHDVLLFHSSISVMQVHQQVHGDLLQCSLMVDDSVASNNQSASMWDWAVVLLHYTFKVKQGVAGGGSHPPV